MNLRPKIFKQNGAKHKGTQRGFTVLHWDDYIEIILIYSTIKYLGWIDTSEQIIEARYYWAINRPNGLWYRCGPQTRCGLPCVAYHRTQRRN